MNTPTEEQRKLIVQELIDRMLYLPSQKKLQFITYLLDLIDDFKIEHHTNEEGVRIYSQTHKLNETI